MTRQFANMLRRHLIALSIVGLLTLGMTACVGTIVGTAVDVGIEVVKVPFKVAGAAVDVVTDDDDDGDEEYEEDSDD